MRAQIQALRDRGPEGEAEIFEDYVSGMTLQKITEKYKVGRRSFYNWLDESPERRKLWEEARKLRAEVLADEAKDIVDEARETPDAIAKAIARAKVRQWLAAVSDPQRFGKRPDTIVQIGAVHLEAVKEINAADTERRLVEARAKEVPPDYEFVDDRPPASAPSLAEMLS